VKITGERFDIATQEQVFEQILPFLFEDNTSLKTLIEINPGECYRVLYKLFTRRNGAILKRMKRIPLPKNYESGIGESKKIFPQIVRMFFDIGKDIGKPIKPANAKAEITEKTQIDSFWPYLFVMKIMMYKKCDIPKDFGFKIVLPYFIEHEEYLDYFLPSNLQAKKKFSQKVKKKIVILPEQAEEEKKTIVQSLDSSLQKSIFYNEFMLQRLKEYEEGEKNIRKLYDDKIVKTINEQSTLYSLFFQKIF